MTNRTTRRVETLERMVKDAGMLDAKIDVTEHFKVIQDVYGIPGDIEPVIMRARDWQRLIETIITVYGG